MAVDLNLKVLVDTPDLAGRPKAIRDAQSKVQTEIRTFNHSKEQSL